MGRVIPWLFMILTDDLPRAWLPDDPGTELRVDGQTYAAWGDGPIGGFFDRLELRNGRLGGIRFAPTPAYDLAAKLGGSSRLRLSLEGQVLDVLLRQTGTEELKVVPEQAFGGRLYEGAFGDVALCFDTDLLTERQRIELQAELPANLIMEAV